VQSKAIVLFRRQISEALGRARGAPTIGSSSSRRRRCL
jgi:hypothetical protein